MPKSTTPPVRSKRPLNRREVLRTTTLAAAAVGVAAPFVSRGRVLGANDTIGVGLIGVGGRGWNHLSTVRGMEENKEGVRIIAVNDAYGPRLRKAAEGADGVKAYQHHAELLADPAVDVVCIATPDRLHVPQAIDAIRAGKDVYCEKPMGHWSQFDLSRKFFHETMERKRIVQIGNQGNSAPAWQKVAELVQSGAIGRPIHVTVGYWRDGDWGERMPIPDQNAKPGPDLDWNAFLGDAPKVPFTVDRFFSWRKYLDYAGGPCTDLLPHVYTPFVSALKLGIPTRVVGSGGIYEYTTYDREVADTYNQSMDYAQGLSVTLMCTLANEFQTEPVIRGDEGAMTLQGPAWEAGFDSITVIPKKGERKVIPGGRLNATLGHWRNLIECVRSRAKPVSDVEFGFKVQAALCMGMLSHLNNKVARYDAQKEKLIL
jgi:predicted dehydrogenase